MYGKIVELAKRRGFFWPSFEIYGGLSGYVDFGPLGTKLKNNIIELWREHFIKKHSEFIVEIETPIIMPHRVFEASGHVKHFTDYMVKCSKCGRIYRADHLIEEQTGIKAEGKNLKELQQIILENDVKCRECGGKLGNVESFNLLMKTNVGPYEGTLAYGRPEAAQGMFINFKRVYEQMGEKLPFGIAQIGKVMRNEISPRQTLIRMREFTIMEIEFFFDERNPRCDLLDQVKDIEIQVIPAEIAGQGVWKPLKMTIEDAVNDKIILNEWNAYFMGIGQQFVEKLGIPSHNQVFLDKPVTERAHYSAQTFDQMVKLRGIGWVEVAGHSYRTDYDLKGHIKYSGVDLRAFRKYPEPKVKREVKIIPRYDILGKKLKGKVKELEKALKSIDTDLLIKELNEKGYVEILGLKVKKDQLKIIEEEMKIYGENFIPHVAEPSYGLERLFYAVMDYAYTEVNGRIVLKLPKSIAPIKIAVFPLVNKNGLPEKAKEIYELLKSEGFDIVYNDSEFIGKLYAWADEIGIPVAITVDYDTLKDNTVTLRNRDDWSQVRVPIEKLSKLLSEFLKDKKKFRELGPLFKPGREIK